MHIYTLAVAFRLVPNTPMGFVCSQRTDSLSYEYIYTPVLIYKLGNLSMKHNEGRN